MSFKPEVSTDGGRTFHQNALALATREEAAAADRSDVSSEDYCILLLIEGHHDDRRVEE